ncbi:lathosterol oxidase-like [Anneissia japonica]|uniref:lathosterol oxidase-like n=1 Tax=Anneissia japonica TaxID=1529436 RepID=UPI0014256678|nr:lathosterol oxidase-like [Anneissia japonica]
MHYEMSREDPNVGRNQREPPLHGEHFMVHGVKARCWSIPVFEGLTQRPIEPFSTMDVVLDLCDNYVLTPYVYPESWKEDDIVRQFISLFFITDIGGTLVYLIPATFSYFFIFDHKLKQHPLFLKVRQVKTVYTIIDR